MDGNDKGTADGCVCGGLRSNRISVAPEDEPPGHLPDPLPLPHPLQPPLWNPRAPIVNTCHLATDRSSGVRIIAQVGRGEDGLLGIAVGMEEENQREGTLTG